MPIIITSKKAGFRRCGIAHPAEPVEYPDNRFTPEQLEKLQKEPMLVVQIIKDLKKEKEFKEPQKTKEVGTKIKGKNLLEGNLDSEQLETVEYQKLKELAKDMNLEFRPNISKKDLIKLIASETVFGDKTAIITAEDNNPDEQQPDGQVSDEIADSQEDIEQDPPGADR